MVIMILYIEFAKRVISTMFHFFKYVFKETYASHVRQNILRMSHDGPSDSGRQCIISHDPYDRVLLRMLLKAFYWFHVCIYFIIVLFVLKGINVLLLLLIFSS